MAINPKVIAQSRPAAASLTAAYTVPGATSVTISSILMHNTDTLTTDTALVKIAPSGAGDSTIHQAWNINVPPEGTVIVTAGLTLTATDIVRVQSTNGTVNFHLYGIEET